MHETEIFKVCIKTLQQSQLAHVLNAEESKRVEEGGIELQHQFQYKKFCRVWQAYTKYLRSHVLERDLVVHCQYFGTFSLKL